MQKKKTLFHPHRALGLVCNQLPLVVRYIKRRKENLIATSIGNTFHTYGANKLGLLSVGNPHPSPITCLSADAYHIYTSSANIIYAWRRGTELKHRYLGHKSEVHTMLPFGPHLISIDRTNNLKIWDIKDESLYLEKSFDDNNLVACLLHPATYLNKILIAMKDGKMILWNMKSNSDVYIFKGWNSEVTALEQAPAVDVAAVGLANGKVILHNLKFDETIIEFNQDWGRVTSISFRTDGFPIMVTGSELGHIAVWNLEDRKLSSQIRDAHDGSIAGLKCLPNEPLLVSSSIDNSIKMWIFDLPDGGARLLKFRDGHSGAPLLARFHGSLGNTIISAGEDSVMRLFSTATDVINKSLGQASYNRKASKRSKDAYERLKMPPITMFTSETAQETAWDNVAAIHRGKTLVTTWTISQQKMGSHKLIHQRFKEKSLARSIATCLELTVCGNYVVIGYDSGHVDKYNIQSGMHRGSFGQPTAHSDSVRGLATDSLNKCVISGGQEGELRWWSFKTCRGLKKIVLGVGVSKMVLHRESNLLAVSLDDWTVNIIDADTKVIVRKLVGHQNQITDLCYSPDSKWLVTCSLDKSIRTWDIPSGQCIDCFEVPVPASSIAFSPINDFLVTCHAGHLGICLWANLSCYDNISLQPLSYNYEPQVISLPSTAADEAQMPPAEGDEMSMEISDLDDDNDDEYKSPEQINSELVTLALIPGSRWLNLLNIDIIKKRNKPLEPPKVPKSAPFFLPTVPGLEGNIHFDISSSKNNKTVSKIKAVDSFEILSAFGEKLKLKQYTAALEMLMSFGPAAVDVEIRGLDPDIGGSKDLLIQFLKMIENELQNRKHFEAIHGFFGLFLKIYGDYIIENVELKSVCDELQKINKKVWSNLKGDFDHSLSILSYIKNSALLNT